jgi:hypothetical protein
MTGAQRSQPARHPREVKARTYTQITTIYIATKAIKTPARALKHIKIRKTLKNPLFKVLAIGDRR